jgi:hypothetical protein
MIKALIRTIVLVGAVLLLASFVPFVAAHETLALILAVLVGLSGLIVRTLFVGLLLAAAVVVWLLSTNFL